MKALAILCANIRRVRLAREWSQEALAKKAGLAPRHLQDIEAGRREGVRLETIDRIAKALRLNAWELLQQDRFPDPVNRRGKRQKIAR